MSRHIYVNTHSTPNSSKAIPPKSSTCYSHSIIASCMSLSIHMHSRKKHPPTPSHYHMHPPTPSHYHMLIPTTCSCTLNHMHLPHPQFHTMQPEPHMHLHPLTSSCTPSHSAHPHHPASSSSQLQYPQTRHRFWGTTPLPPQHFPATTPPHTEPQ